MTMRTVYPLNFRSSQRSIWRNGAEWASTVTTGTAIVASGDKAGVSRSATCGARAAQDHDALAVVVENSVAWLLQEPLHRVRRSASVKYQDAVSLGAALPVHAAGREDLLEPRHLCTGQELESGVI